MSDNSTNGEAGGQTFDEIVLPHLDAAHRLARSLLASKDDAADVVQDASLRALRYFDTFVGGNGRAWFLKIVRNACYGRYRNTLETRADEFDEQCHSDVRLVESPEMLAVRAEGRCLVASALRRLPPRARALLMLRELEGLSYREIGDVLGMPAGTVMSSLWRARMALRRVLDAELNSALRTSSAGARSLDPGALPPPMDPWVALRNQEDR